MRNNPLECFFTDFSCGLFGFDIEWQASNSSAQSMKGNRAIHGDRILLDAAAKYHNHTQ